MSLFSSFKPTEWAEGAYTRNPPFTVETASGRVFVVPRDPQAESILDGISSSLGLKKVKQGHVSYLVSKGPAIKGLREFDWYVRRSWRKRELSVLWALAYVGEKCGWSQGGLQLQTLADAAGVTAKEGSESLHRLFNSRAGDISTRTLSEIALDREQVRENHAKEVSELPI